MNKKNKALLVLGGIAAVGVAAFTGYKNGHDKGCLEVTNKFGEMIPDVIEKVTKAASCATICTMDKFDPGVLGPVLKMMPDADEFFGTVLECTLKNGGISKLSEIGKAMAVVKKW